MTPIPEVVTTLTLPGVVVPIPIVPPLRGTTSKACVAKPTLLTITLTSKLTPYVPVAIPTVLINVLV